MEQTSGFMLTGFAATIFLVVWLAAVLVYGFVRSTGAAEPDPIRLAGPFDEE